MSGTKEGAQKAKQINYERYGPDFYKKIGAIGGRAGSTGGYASKEVGSDGLTGKQRASKWGQIGGLKSRRGKATKTQ